MDLIGTIGEGSVRVFPVGAALEFPGAGGTSVVADPKPAVEEGCEDAWERSGDWYKEGVYVAATDEGCTG